MKVIGVLSGQLLENVAARSILEEMRVQYRLVPAEFFNNKNMRFPMGAGKGPLASLISCSCLKKYLETIIQNQF